MDDCKTLDALLTPAEVARILRLKISTVYHAASVGRIPCVRLWSGQRRAVVRFRREDIERLICERRHSSSHREA
jgi:excisionase family DNA binding protein